MVTTRPRRGLIPNSFHSSGIGKSISGVASTSSNCVTASDKVKRIDTMNLVTGDNAKNTAESGEYSLVDDEE